MRHGNALACPSCGVSEPEECSLADEAIDKLNGLERMKDEIQQMESTNRWRLLQSQTPAHDVGALRRKVRRRLYMYLRRRLQRHNVNKVVCLSVCPAFLFCWRDNLERKYTNKSKVKQEAKLSLG